VADDVWPVLAHELGHNMSMQHANALLCPTAADSAYSTTTSKWTGAGCSEDGYGDGQDVMAASISYAPYFAPFLSAPQSLRTGIIPPTAATVIDTVGTQSVTLLPLAGRTGVRAAEVVNPSTGATYYVEYRTKAGRDLQNVYGVKTGVRVLRFNPDDGATVLLDPSPTGQSRDPDPTLSVGQTFTSYDGDVRIRTLSADSTNAVVSITNGTSTVTAPGAPTAVTATAGDRSAAVFWASPVFDGGAQVTGYSVTATPGGRTATTAGATTTTVTGLSNGTAYSFTVTATNGIGTSQASTPGTPVTPSPSNPSRPSTVTATAGDAAASVSWMAPVSDGGSPVTGYTVNATPGGRTAATTGATTATVTGLTNGTAYTFTVSATNAVGTSPASAASASVTPTSPMVGFTGMTPTRVLNTLNGTGAPKAKLGATRTLTLTVPGLPLGTTAVAINVMVTNPTATGYLTVYPGGKPRPGASNLTFVANQTIPNLVLVPLGPGNTVTFYNSAGTVNVLGDLVGYYK
jgi:Fibronectin type III domain